VIVPFGTGGATFVSAKFLEPYFEKHLPGNPEINVIDRPGGGSILGANWFEQNARSDGTTILFTTSSTANPFVLGQEGVQYRLADYRVAYSHPFSSVAYVSPSTGVTSAENIKEASTRSFTAASPRQPRTCRRSCPSRCWTLTSSRCSASMGAVLCGSPSSRAS
jgi:tripartite-type tricarboxylate transporter receptor subunit TctC